MDLVQAHDLTGSLLWGEVVKELDKKIAFETSKLRSCLPEELREIQIRIACYESLKSLPLDVIDRES